MRSIVGRYLEHSRIYHFANGRAPGAPCYLIGSADLMPRNLDRRVEVLVPVDDPELQHRLQEMLDVELADDVLAWNARRRRTGGAGAAAGGEHRDPPRAAAAHGGPCRPGGVRLGRVTGAGYPVGRGPVAIESPPGIEQHLDKSHQIVTIRVCPMTHRQTMRCCASTACTSRLSAWRCCGRCPAPRTAPPTTSARSSGPRSARSPAKPSTTCSAALTDKGILRRIQPAGSPARYEDRVGDNHHHLICRACGRTVDVDCAVGEVPCLTAADDAGYEVDEAEVIYWGRCPDCVSDSCCVRRLNHAPTSRRPAARPIEQHGARRTPCRESENPVIDAPEPKGHRPRSEPGLVARPAGPLGAPPALAERRPDG